MGENIRKNVILTTVLERFSDDWSTFSKTYQPSWHWVGTGKERIFHLVMPTLDAVEKMMLQAAVDIVRSGKVVVE